MESIKGMNVHVYQKDTTVVLMGHVKIADWRTELRHFELSLEVADALLQKLPVDENELRLSGKDLLELLQHKGETASYVKLSAAKDKVIRTLTALTKAAWEYEVPFSVDEAKYAEGDEYFEDFSAAYVVEDKAIVQESSASAGGVDG